MKDYIELFLIFLKMGAITFGGGYAIMPILEREIINKKGWVTIDEVIEYYAIAQVTPGVIAINVSTFIGFKRKGIAGGIIATTAFMLPGILFIIIISKILQRYKDIPIVQHAFAGIRLTVGALILSTVIKLIKSFFQKDRAFYKNLIASIICIAAFLLSFIYKTNPAFIVIAAGLTGFLFFKTKKL